MKKRIALALLGALLVMASAPTLEKRHHKYFLRFTYTEEVTLTKTPVKEQVICSVDLGINTDAVCTIMRADGTVLGRRFIDHPSEKDRMYRALGRIRRFQREHGSAQTQVKLQEIQLKLRQSSPAKM
jgi:transposase